jgi:hypothetical protein
MVVELGGVMSPVKLAVQTLLTILAMVIGMGAQLFLPAWTLDYWQAWVFIVLVVGCSNAIGVYLALKDPALLARRRRAGPTAETRPAQRIAQTFLILSFAGVLVLSALDHRFVWSPAVPTLVTPVRLTPDDAELGRRHVSASAQAICPSNPRDFAIAW